LLPARRFRLDATIFFRFFNRCRQQWGCRICASAALEPVYDTNGATPTHEVPLARIKASFPFEDARKQGFIPVPIFAAVVGEENQFRAVRHAVLDEWMYSITRDLPRLPVQIYF
jgi:hypothetical protein